MVGAETGKRSKGKLFWGNMNVLDAPMRAVALAFVVASIVAMSFCQLGFWPIGVIDGKSVYLMLILGPLVMGALMFGPLTGALLGLFAGAVLYAHAMFFPLDYYEIYYMSPVNTFVLLALVGALAGWLFSLVLRRDPKPGARMALISAICLFVSFATSALLSLGVVITYGGLQNAEAIEDIYGFLLNSPLGATVQALIDAACMALLCLSTDSVIRRVRQRGNDRRLLSVFRNWMFLVSAIVFMLASALIFSIASLQAQDSASEDMLSEVHYLENQLTDSGSRDYGRLLDGYDVPLDGSVVVIDEAGAILASNDERYPAGEDFLALIGYDGDGFEQAYGQLLLDLMADGDEINELETVDESGVQTMNILFAAFGKFEGGYIGLLRTSDMIYASRFDMMASSTTLAIVLIAAIAVLATVLLRRVVVRRIDETNGSLAKITDGNLNERVRVLDSREFTSLSTGINTTVAALKDTIAEVEQKNAQDLATAKTIQESALPREFPPFPQIDKFDIYASMKTAKEVGGDFYDFFLIDDDGKTGDGDRLGFVLADVSGKGIPAALFMMAAKTQIQNYMEAGLPLGQAVDAANHQLCIGNEAGMFVTTWVGVLDYRTGLLTYVNGGHNPPMLLHDGAWEWVKDISGMPLGLFDGIPYEAFTRQLDVGDVLYLYTDGVTEAMDADGALFGEERLERTLARYENLNPRSLGVGVRRAITDFTLDAEQSDDITMFILKYGVPPEKKAVMVLKAEVEQLVHVFNFIHEELKRRRAPKSVYNPLDIAAEELFVNVCHYAYPDATPEEPGEVRIGFEYEATPPTLTVTISDDGIPYDPLAKPDAVTPDDIMDVPIGGLGILMAKNSVDDMSYERVANSNVTTFVKKW